MIYIYNFNFLSISPFKFPSHSVLPFLFMSIIYWMSNLNNDINKFFICGSLVVLAAQASLAFGHFLSAVSPSSTVATGIAGPFLGLVMIFSGHFLNIKSIPFYFLWTRYVSWLAYANEALIINQWKDVKHIECDKYSLRCLSTGDHVMDYLNMEPVSFCYYKYN